MGCCGAGRAGRLGAVKYKVTFTDGTVRVFLTRTEARLAVTQSGMDATIDTVDAAS